MTTLPTIFLTPTLQGAKEHGVEALILPDDQGLILFPAGFTPSAQAILLKKMATGLHGAQPPADPQEQPPENSGTDAAPTNIDCQVSVEERAQLFKFLTG